MSNRDSIQSIQIADYKYELPDHRIAKFPLKERDQSKLLIYKQGEIAESKFSSLPELLTPNSLMVFNNTKVIQARLYFRKESGAKIEIFCLEPHAPNDYLLSFQSTESCTWICMVGNLKKWKEGELSLLVECGENSGITLRAKRLGTLGNAQLIDFQWDNKRVAFGQILEAIGELPIPPYLNRETEEADKESYQTVYSKIEGSVAAPTAGLHFTDAVFGKLAEKSIDCRELTLHVGAGTFRPVKSDSIGEHEMHTEFISVQKSLVEALLANPSVIAVGTTSVRTLESLYYIGCLLNRQPDISLADLKVTQWMPYSNEFSLSLAAALMEIICFCERKKVDTIIASTQIMIVPGYEFKLVKGIVTNFHQPSSTLLLLVSAFVDGNWRAIYDYALAHDFRFLSYGDSSLLLK